MAAFTTGDRVLQASYGLGTVMSSNERHIVIDFDDHGIHTFVTTVVRLQVSDVPAPGRPAKRKTTRKTKATATSQG